MKPINLKKNLFDAFSQSDVSVSRQYGGTGLGLTICKNLTDMMAGKIWVESEFEVGSTFHFSVRLQKQKGQASITQRLHKTNQQEENYYVRKIQGSQILLVEDNEVNRELPQELLVSHGISVMFAKNGLEALEILKDKMFDGVLMDCQMPVMDGYTATRKIRDQAHFNIYQLLQ